MKKLFLILYTIIHLRPIQIHYQIWYRLRRMWRKLTGFKYLLSIKKEGTQLNFVPWIKKQESLRLNVDAGTNFPYWEDRKRFRTFKFLNFPQTYKNSINWNEPAFGALWTYNLNYMDYLNQPGMDKESGLQLIDDFIQNLTQNSTGLDPYPIALRGINWIKFLSKHLHHNERQQEALKQPINIKQIDSSLNAQYHILFDNLEYHLLGNHLLEDGFSLLFGAFYFNEEKFYKKANEIIYNELKEQILDDGSHFELSPMYHQIILDRLLDCINLIQNNSRFESQENLLTFMQEKAQKMLKWLDAITFSNGQIPLLNDSAPNIAPTTEQLLKYATNLNLQHVSLREVEGRNLKLSSSGYRRFNSSNYECIIDIGQIGPSYQPGHAHADTFNLVLNINNQTFIVDTGVSTYISGDTRLKERGTASHNTVTVSQKNSSRVWSSFRVARRAKVKIIQDNEKTVYAEHTGYRNIGVIHQRKWTFNETNIEITDTLNGKTTLGKAHFWLAPHLHPKKNLQTIEFEDICITFKNADSIEILSSQIPNGYNQFLKNYKIEIVFKKQLITQITTKKTIIH